MELVKCFINPAPNRPTINRLMMKLILKFFSEIRRRNVIPTLVPYLGVAWLVIQIVQVLSGTLNWSSWIGTLTTIVFFAGFPVMAYIAWYFDITRDGLVKIPDIKGDIKPLGKLRWTGLVAILVVSVWLGNEMFVSVRSDLAKQSEGTASNFDGRSVAVLPFIDLSTDQSQLYLAQGISEEITNLLGQISQLSIAATSSTFTLANRNLTPVDIGKRLDVDAVLSGSIRVNGSRLKVRSELINTANGHVVWSQSFSRNFNNIFEVEEEISRAIANLLHDRYLEAGQVTTQAKTASTDAYVIYLKGRQAYRQQTTEQFKIARKHFEQAIALDPEYSAAYIALANTVLMLEKGDTRYGILETDIAIKLAEQHLNNAFLRSPENPNAFTVQGKLFELKNELDAALSSYDKAISLNPSLAIAHMWRFILLKRLSRFDESFMALKTAYELDPLSSTNLYNLGYEYANRAQYAKAKEFFNILLTDFPESPQGDVGLAHTAYIQGQFAKSLEHWHKAKLLSPEDDNYTYGYLGTLIALELPSEVRKITQDHSYEPTLLLMEEKPEALKSTIDFQLGAYPEDHWIKFESAWYLLLNGEQEAGIELLISIHDSFDEAELYAMPYCSPAIEIAWALLKSDKIKREEKENDKAEFKNRAHQLINRCKTQILQAQQDSIIDSAENYLAARIAIIQGDNYQAYQSLKLALENGWLEWWTKKDPLLSPAFQDQTLAKEFEQLINKLDKRLSEEQTAAIAYLANMDLQSSKTPAK